MIRFVFQFITNLFRFFNIVVVTANTNVRGCRDILPRTAHGRRALVSKFAQLCYSYGFSEIETPILERASVFSRALGSTSDIVSSELFHIATRQCTDSDAVVLRPEGTAPVLRSVSARRGAAPFPHFGTRVWYTGPMFRHERPQRLRLRQFTQLGVEIISDNSLTADVDCIALAESFLRETPRGSNAILRINTLGSQADRERYNEALTDYLKPPRYGALSPISRNRVDAGRCLRVLDSKLSEDIDVMRGAPPLFEFISAEEKNRFQMLQTRLKEEGISFEFDPTLVRGLDYYTSTAFEFVHQGRAVAAGGRYTDVHELSGVGFAIGMERVEDPEWQEQDAETFTRFLEGGITVLPIGAGNREDSQSEVGAACRRIARELRSVGVRTVVRLEQGKLGKQISRAIKSGSWAVVMIGESDLAMDTAKVKLINHAEADAAYEQFDVGMNEVANFCKRLISVGSVNTECDSDNERTPRANSVMSRERAASGVAVDRTKQ